MMITVAVSTLMPNGRHSGVNRGEGGASAPSSSSSSTLPLKTLMMMALFGPVFKQKIKSCVLSSLMMRDVERERGEKERIVH